YGVIDALPNGMSIGLSGRTSGGWSQLSNGYWVSSSWISGGGGSGGGGGGSGAFVSTNGSYLNVRTGPGFEYGVIDALPNGMSIGLSGRASGGWSQLSNGYWVSSSWIR
nr:SH3 domain-containing protein [Leptolyngbyaceae cyanobacterium MO_188.B28]